MKGHILIFITVMTLAVIAAPAAPQVESVSGLEYEFDKSWWLFTSGNETVQEWRDVRLADGAVVNSTISTSYIKNSTITWYYSPSGALRGWDNNETRPGGGVFGEWRFSEVNYTLGERTYMFSERLNITSTDINGSRFYNYPYNFTVKPQTNFTMSSGKTVGIYPFVALVDISLRNGTGYYDYDDRSLRERYFGNGTIERVDIYPNGTEISARYQISSIYLNISGYFAPSIYRIAKLSFDIVSGETLRLMGDGGFNEDAAKTLEDYYVSRVDDSFTFTSGPGGSNDPTVTEAPLLFLPVLAALVLRKKRAIPK